MSLSRCEKLIAPSTRYWVCSSATAGAVAAGLSGMASTRVCMGEPSGISGKDRDGAHCIRRCAHDNPQGSGPHAPPGQYLSNPGHHKDTFDQASILGCPAPFALGV